MPDASRVTPLRMKAAPGGVLRLDFGPGGIQCGAAVITNPDIEFIAREGVPP